MVLEGVRPDNEVALGCESCGMRMDWVIFREEQRHANRPDTTLPHELPILVRRAMNA